MINRNCGVDIIFCAISIMYSVRGMIMIPLKAYLPSTPRKLSGLLQCYSTRPHIHRRYARNGRRTFPALSSTSYYGLIFSIYYILNTCEQLHVQYIYAYLPAHKVLCALHIHPLPSYHVPEGSSMSTVVNRISTNWKNESNDISRKIGKVSPANHAYGELLVADETNPGPGPQSRIKISTIDRCATMVVARNTSYIMLDYL